MLTTARMITLLQKPTKRSPNLPEYQISLESVQNQFAYLYALVNESKASSRWTVLFSLQTQEKLNQFKKSFADNKDGFLIFLKRYGLNLTLKILSCLQLAISDEKVCTLRVILNASR